MSVGYIFGYGSLAHPEDWARKKAANNKSPVWGKLSGYRRTWRVAIDNQSPEYNFKHYLYKGKRANCAVATLGLYPANSFCNGLALPVSSETLVLLDQREKSYIRSDNLSHLFSQELDLPLWTYLPKESMFQTFNGGNVFLPRAYLETCKEAFAGRWSDFLSSTDPIACRVLDLELFRAPGKKGL